MEQEEKYKKRSNKWKKRICLTEENYDFIHDEMIRKKYKTLAGTLDSMLNSLKSQMNEKGENTKS